MKDYIEENINEKEFINKLEYFIKNIDNEIDENFANMISPYHFSELKENKISKKVLTVRKIGDKVLLVFEKQDKTQEAEKRKRENF